MSSVVEERQGTGQAGQPVGSSGARAVRRTVFWILIAILCIIFVARAEKPGSAPSQVGMCRPGLPTVATLMFS